MDAAKYSAIELTTYRGSLVQKTDKIGIVRPLPGPNGQCRIWIKLCLPPWGPHVRFRRVQTLVREGSPLVKLRNSA